MVGLLDLAPSTRKVHGVPVPGLSAEGLIFVVTRFPIVLEIIGGMTPTSAPNPRELIALAPAAIKAVIAAGCGYPDDAKQEAAAGRMPLEMQVDFLEAIIEVTCPSGIGPFVQRLLKAGEAAERMRVGSAPAAPASSSKSARLSPGSYKRVNTRPIVPGDTPRAKSKAG